MPAPTSTSLVDRVNDADEAIGVIERGRVLEHAVGFRVVHVVVFNAAGQVLLQQVGRSRERSPLLWGSSVAGYLHAGESYADAARRRLNEELGLRTPIAKVGSTRMRDGEATKFITLFCTQADAPHIEDPTHIEMVEFQDPEQVDRKLAEDPHRFTETFPHVWALFRAL